MEVELDVYRVYKEMVFVSVQWFEMVSVGIFTRKLSMFFRLKYLKLNLLQRL